MILRSWFLLLSIKDGDGGGTHGKRQSLCGLETNPERQPGSEDSLPLGGGTAHAVLLCRPSVEQGLTDGLKSAKKYTGQQEVV